MPLDTLRWPWRYYPRLGFSEGDDYPFEHHGNLVSWPMAADQRRRPYGKTWSYS